jgi:putative ABC transport system substrate-binding protein
LELPYLACLIAYAIMADPFASTPMRWSMRRREFIAGLIGGAATPLASGVLAKVVDRIPQIGVLMAVAQNDPMGQPWVTALEERLEQRGWQIGQTLRINYRWAGGSLTAVAALADELVGLHPEILLATNTATAVALQHATHSIPIVFLLADPVAGGLVTNLAHPDGNMTGFIANEPVVAEKQLQLLKDIAPSIQRVAILSNPAAAPFRTQWVEFAERAAGSLGMGEVVPMPVDGPEKIEDVMQRWSEAPSAALLVLGDSTTLNNRHLIAALAVQYRLPAMYQYRFFVTAGGLACYGPDITEQYRQAAQYIDQILHRANISDLPVQAPTTFELVINLRAAREIGLEFSTEMLHLAAEVIE